MFERFTQPLRSFITMGCLVYLLLAMCISLINAESDGGSPVRLGEHQPPTGMIPELQFAPSSMDFYEKYFKTSTPVIIRGIASRWPAFTLWKNLTYLREAHGDSLFQVEQRKAFRNSHPVKNAMKLSDFLDLFEADNVYLDSLISSGSSMLDEIPLPVPLQCREFSKGVSAIAFLMSSGGTSSAFHHDGYENILTLLSGEKEVILYNSSCTADLRGDQYDLVPGVSPIEPENVDMSKFQFIKGLPFVKGKLYAGDALFIPQFWWHHVRSYGNPNIALSIWFGLVDVAEKMNEMLGGGVLEELNAYLQAMSQQPSKIKCRNHAKPLDQFLFVNPNEDSSLRYRIPKLNKRPEDTLLASGYTMPVLGLGTGGLNETAQQSVKYALEAGYRMFDSAELYEGSEEAIAAALIEAGIPRSDVFIASKVAPRNLGYSTTLEAIEGSLRRLNTTYIDLYYIHAKSCDDCENGTGTWQDSWRAMEQAHRDGKIRSLGLSNIKVKDLKELASFATVPVSAVQNWFDAFHQERKLRRYCQEHNIRFVGYSTLGQQWTSLGLTENPLLTLELITDISAHYDYIASHVLLRWAVHENVTVIPRSSSQNHIGQNYRAMDIKLRTSEIQAIRKLEELMREVFQEEVEPDLGSHEKEVEPERGTAEHIGRDTIEETSPPEEGTVIEEIKYEKGNIEKTNQATTEEDGDPISKRNEL